MRGATSVCMSRQGRRRRAAKVRTVTTSLDDFLRYVYEISVRLERLTEDRKG